MAAREQQPRCDDVNSRWRFVGPRVEETPRCGDARGFRGAGRLERDRFNVSMPAWLDVRRLAIDDQPGDALLALARTARAERIGRARRRPGDGDPASKPVEDARLRGVAGDQMKGVDGPRLADSVDAPDPLFEPHRPTAARD